jgi:hypothetical protein
VGGISRYQKGDQNASIEEEQTTQWPTAKMQKDKQRFIKHAHKTKDRVTRTQLRQGVISGVPEGQTVPAPLMMSFTK